MAAAVRRQPVVALEPGEVFPSDCTRNPERITGKQRLPVNMHVEMSSIGSGALWETHARVECGVQWGRRGSRRTRIWFDLPKALRPDLNPRADVWLVALLPWAMRLGEPLQLSNPVDQTLLANATKLMTIWSAWRPELQVVPIQAESVTATPAAEPARFASFFTAGVDSFFTALHPGFGQTDPALTAAGAQHELLYVIGFDVRLDHPELFPVRLGRLQEAADELGRPLHILATNLRALDLPGLSWGEIYHGAALGAVGQLLAGRYRRVLIASTYGPRDLSPFGSHPDTDPLMSSAALTFIHHGQELRRSEKFARLVDHELFLRSLQVCYLSPVGGNCGRCRKCLLTLAMLDLLGKLDRARTFSAAGYSLEQLRRMKVRVPGPSLTGELLDTATALGREDVAGPLRDCLAWNLRNQRFVDTIGRLALVPGMGPIARSLQRKAARRLWAGAAA